MYNLVSGKHESSINLFIQSTKLSVVHQISVNDMSINKYSLLSSNRTRSKTCIGIRRNIPMSFVKDCNSNTKTIACKKIKDKLMANRKKHTTLRCTSINLRRRVWR